MQYTPGPWKWVEQYGGGWALVTYHPTYDGVVIEDSMGKSIGFMNEGKHDANLIEAAPDLAEALEEAVKLSGENEYGVEASWVPLAVQALAKAKGEM